MMVFHRAHPIPVAGQLGNELLDQTCFTDFLGADDEQKFLLRRSPIDAVSINSSSKARIESALFPRREMEIFPL